MHQPTSRHSDATTAGVARGTGRAGLFNRLAPVYDEDEPRHFSRLGRRLVQWAGVPPAGHVIDVATGRGAVLFAAAHQAARAVGVDLAPAMVEHVRAQAVREGADNVEVRVMDAQRLAFPDEDFDAAYCAFALFLMPAPRLALHEMVRVTRAGGRVAIAAFGPRDPRWAWLSQLPASHDNEGGLKRADDVGVALADMGCTEVEITSTAIDLGFDDGDHWFRWASSHGYQGSFDRLGAGFETFRCDALQRMEAARSADGSLRMTMVAEFVRARC